MKTIDRQLNHWIVLAVVAAAAVMLLVAPARTVLAQKTVSIPHFNEAQLPAPISGSVGAPAVTVFVDRGPEKVKAAQILTEIHAAMAARGYTFAELDPYLENNDLEGWWVTYVAH